MGCVQCGTIMSQMCQRPPGWLCPPCAGKFDAWVAKKVSELPIDNPIRVMPAQCTCCPVHRQVQPDTGSNCD